ncbi:LOW QUALITY PROTEIN: 2-haloalkanoic acid dehalogenase [Bacillus sp. JCM 19046]|nr:LOW QUALITY PROTEIN: 2-haloalkanoic acid dehalogenase [Bacillus sp. JCM 19046]
MLWDKQSIQLAFEQTCLFARQEHPDLDPVQLEQDVREAAKKLYQSYDSYAFTQNIGINPFEGLWGQFRDEMEGFEQLRDIAPSYQLAAWEKGLEKAGSIGTLLQVLANQFPLERRKHPIVYEDTFQVLDQLHHTFQLLLLTNGSPDLQNTKLEITPQLVPYFDHIIISGSLLKGKPDSKMFLEGLYRAGIHKEEAIMVGDNLHTDIKGANASGIYSIWLNRDHVINETDIVPNLEIHSLEELLQLPILKK